MIEGRVLSLRMVITHNGHKPTPSPTSMQANRLGAEKL